MLMDVVYPYKRTPDDYELRFSLRSLANLPHRGVIVSGDVPAFASEELCCLAVDPVADRYRSSTANILAAAERGDVTDDFIVMHDDIFLMAPHELRHENRGTIREYLATGKAAGEYRERIVSTAALLRAEGIEDPLWFGLHTPTVYNRGRLIDLIRAYEGKPYLLRTLYHNIYPAPSERADDVKVRRWTGYAGETILSANDAMSIDAGFRAWLEGMFPELSRYEYRAKGKCLILGYGASVWEEAYAAGRDFEAVIASPEAAQHQSSGGCIWGGVRAVGNTDEHCLYLARMMGFSEAQIVFAGRQKAEAAA